MGEHLKEYLELMRVKHYIKNLLVFIPAFFAGKIFQMDIMKQAVLGFLAFCFLCSSIYILNDYMDIEKDKKHSTKRFRPLASGKVSKKEALSLGLICIVLVIVLSFIIQNRYATVFLLIYFIANIGYSLGLKKKPIIDIVILASGFVLRVLYGGAICSIPISKWLYLVVTMGSIYMGLGKRRNELMKQKDTRDVLRYYNVSFLDKNMYVCVAMTNVFYALWTIEMPSTVMIWTVPLFFVLLMCYSLATEGESDGDPVEVILHNKWLIIASIFYAICIFMLIYFWKG